MLLTGAVFTAIYSIEKEQWPDLKPVQDNTNQNTNL